MTALACRSTAGADRAATLVMTIGAPLYFGGLHHDMQGFVTQYRIALIERPVAVFALGPIIDPIDEAEWDSARGALSEALSAFAWLAPIDVELFGGKFDPASLGLRDRLIASLPASPLHGMPASDLRDWTAIQEWARRLTRILVPVEADLAPNPTRM
jgi:menaquinone-dependent protoporphyrinogen oxidase